MFNTLLAKYYSLLNDVNLGTPLTQEAINECLDLIAKIYLVWYNPDDSLSLKIREYYG